MFHNIDLWCLVLQFLDQDEQIEVMKVSTLTYEASTNPFFWKTFNFTDEEIFKFLNLFFKDQNLKNIPKSYLGILKFLVGEYLPLHCFSKNYFSHPRVLEQLSTKDSKENLKYLISIGYPLKYLYFTHQDEYAKCYYGSRIRSFSVLHYLVWTNNVELTRYIIQNEILKQTLDGLFLYPFVYACASGNVELASLLKMDFQVLQNEPYVKDILNNAYHKHSSLEKLLKEIGFEPFEQLETEDLEEFYKEVVEDEEEKTEPNDVKINDERLYNIGKPGVFEDTNVDLLHESVESSDEDEEENGISLKAIFDQPEEIVKYVIEEFEETYGIIDEDVFLDPFLFPHTKKRKLSKEFIEIPLKIRPLFKTLERRKKNIEDESNESNEDDDEINVEEGKISKEIEKMEIKKIEEIEIKENKEVEEMKKIDIKDMIISKKNLIIRKKVFRKITQDLNDNHIIESFNTYLSNFIYQDATETFLHLYFQDLNKLLNLGIKIKDAFDLLKLYDDYSYEIPWLKEKKEDYIVLFDEDEKNDEDYVEKSDSEDEYDEYQDKSIIEESEVDEDYIEYEKLFYPDELVSIFEKTIEDEDFDLDYTKKFKDLHIRPVDDAFLEKLFRKFIYKYGIDE